MLKKQSFHPDFVIYIKIGNFFGWIFTKFYKESVKPSDFDTIILVLQDTFTNPVDVILNSNLKQKFIIAFILTLN